MDAALQELLALALVALVAGYALWRKVSKPDDAGCSSCKSNPSSTVATENSITPKETKLRFMPKPGSKS